MTDENKKTSQQSSGNAPRGSSRNQASSSNATRPKRGSTGSGQKKYMTQQQKEAQYQRWLYIGLGIAAGLIILSLGIGALWQYRIMPNQVIATVNGQEITRRDYWKYQNISLYNQARVYEELALQYTGSEQSQFLLYSAQLDAARKDVEGSTDVSEATLTQMIEDMLYVQAAEEQGVDMSMPVLQQYALNNFAPLDSPVATAIPSPTLIPERAEWATQTAEADQTAAAQTAEALGTPMATPVAEGTPGATPVVEATPNMVEIEATAQTDYQTFVKEILPDVGLSEAEYLNLFAKPQVARAEVDAKITASVAQSAPQVEVSHILVSTEELANEVYGKITSGEITFEDAAAIYSIDSTTSANGGQLGWVTEGELPTEVDAVVFTMTPDTVSEPIQSGYGWHIVMVTDKDDDRPLTDTQYDNAVAAAKTAMLDEQRAKSEIKSDYYNPTPEPTATAFAAPADAPTPITATPVSAPDLSATPVQGPAIPTSATPEASPVASPEASPASTPA
ncbi:MAG: peptidylprolyl isomerase [Thermomicrobiales bacterium]|nr:peptidylprolyl isomerase [Thermomicrobiales bacterium]